MRGLGFPTDGNDTVKNLYKDATTQVRLPSGGSTQKTPVGRGTIQGVTLSPFLFLLYMEALLQRLHVGGCGYRHTCIPDQNATDTHFTNILRSAAFADDLLCPKNTIQDLKIQARKPTLYNLQCPTLRPALPYSAGQELLALPPTFTLTGLSPIFFPNLLPLVLLMRSMVDWLCQEM